MNQQQLKHLNNRIDAAKKKQKEAIKENPLPELLMLKLKEINKIRHKEYLRKEKLRATVDKRASKIRTILLFGTADEALKAVIKFEQGK